MCDDINTPIFMFYLFSSLTFFSLQIWVFFLILLFSLFEIHPPSSASSAIPLRLASSSAVGSRHRLPPHHRRSLGVVLPDFGRRDFLGFPTPPLHGPAFSAFASLTAASSNWRYVLLLVDPTLNSLS